MLRQLGRKTSTFRRQVHSLLLQSWLLSFEYEIVGGEGSFKNAEINRGISFNFSATTQCVVHFFVCEYERFRAVCWALGLAFAWWREKLPAICCVPVLGFRDLFPDT